MASAGRILIIPKGDYNAETTYEILDLVFHGGTSWLARKNVTGIEPSDANSEYWFKMCEATDLTSVYNRLQALESQIVSAISLDDIDLSGYATKNEVSTVSTDLDNLKTKVSSLESVTGGLPSEFSNFKLISYKGSGACSAGNPVTVTVDFVPKALIMLGFYNSTSSLFYSPFSNTYTRYCTNNVIICDLLTTDFVKGLGFLGMGTADIVSNFVYAKKSADGKTVYWYQEQYPANASCHFNAADSTYYILAVG